MARSKNKKELSPKPLKVYDNLLFISSEKGTKPPLKSDFAIGGDTAQLITAIVIQMNRHPLLAKVIQTAARIYDNSKVVEEEESSVLDCGLPRRFS